MKVDITNGEPFGPQPYLSIKTKCSEYFHDNFDFGKFKKEYYYTFDTHTFDINEVDCIGVASNDIFGNCKVKILELK